MQPCHTVIFLIEYSIFLKKKKNRTYLYKCQREECHTYIGREVSQVTFNP